MSMHVCSKLRAKSIKERVTFGSFIDERTYRLEDDDKIPNQKVHTQNAACISNLYMKKTQQLTLMIQPPVTPLPLYAPSQTTPHKALF